MLAIVGRGGSTVLKEYDVTDNLQVALVSLGLRGL